MTRILKGLTLSALLAVSAAPVLADGIDVMTLTCGNYTDMNANDKILAVNAVKLFAADAKNSEITGELQSTLIDKTDPELQAKVASACLGKDVNLTVFDLLKMN